jgi:hypothetical protein
MIQVVVSVYDRASETFGRPVFVPAKAAAIRSFTDEVNRDDSANDLKRHPDDFDLYVLGNFDDSKGVFSSGDGYPLVLVRGKDVVSA